MSICFLMYYMLFWWGVCEKGHQHGSFIVCVKLWGLASGRGARRASRECETLTQRSCLPSLEVASPQSSRELYREKWARRLCWRDPFLTISQYP